MQLEVSKTERGLGIVNFTDSRQLSCSVQESSNIRTARIWIGLDQPLILNTSDGNSAFVLPEGIDAYSRMLLTQDQVKALLPILQRFVATGTIIEEKCQNCGITDVPIIDGYCLPCGEARDYPDDNSEREEILEAMKTPPEDGYFVWDGKDEDERPLSNEELATWRVPTGMDDGVEDSSENGVEYVFQSVPKNTSSDDDSIKGVISRNSSKPPSMEFSSLKELINDSGFERAYGGKKILFPFGTNLPNITFVRGDVDCNSCSITRGCDLCSLTLCSNSGNILAVSPLDSEKTGFWTTRPADILLSAKEEEA